MVDLAAMFDRTTIAGTSVAEHAYAILEAAMRACDPTAWIREHVAREGDGLLIAGERLAPEAGGALRILGIGKAAPAMVAALLERDGGLAIEALAIGKHGTAMPVVPRLELRTAGHPLPDDDSVTAGGAALALAQRTGPRDRLLAVIGGGASALACVPIEGESLASLRATTDRLARAGTPIEALNRVRGQLDRIKHGGLARAAGGRALALVLDDIPGGDPHAVGSGPLHADGVRHLVVADNERAVAAALAAARARGLPAMRGPALRGEARELGRALVDAIRGYARPFAMVCGGECTVTRRGDGHGGRTLELALAAALALDGRDGITVLAWATDGDDGSSGAAGAVVDGSTCARARALGCDLDAALATSDSATPLARLGDLLVTGPTGTNVCDLVLVLGETRS